MSCSLLGGCLDKVVGVVQVGHQLLETLVGRSIHDSILFEIFLGPYRSYFNFGNVVLVFVRLTEDASIGLVCLVVYVLVLHSGVVLGAFVGLSGWASVLGKGVHLATGVDVYLRAVIERLEFGLI